MNLKIRSCFKDWIHIEYLWVEKTGRNEILTCFLIFISARAFISDYFAVKMSPKICAA